MRNVRYRFLFLLIFACFLVLLTIGLFSDTYTKKLLEQQYVKQMALEAEMLGNFFNEEIARGTTMDHHDLMRFTNDDVLELALFDSNGKLMHTNRESKFNESLWIQVINNKIKKDENYTIFSEKNRFYYVYPLEASNGYFVYGTENMKYERAEIQLWGMIFVVFLICVILCFTFTNRILQRYLNPIDKVTKSLKAVMNGDYTKKIRVYEHNETQLMTQATNDLLTYLEDITKEHLTNEARIKTLIENMSAGLILIDEKGYIQIVNRYLESLIHVHRKDCIGKIYHTAFEQKDMIAIIEEVFINEKKIERQMVMREGLKEKYLNVHGAPIMSNREKWRGVVVVFHDITKLKRLEKTRKDFVANVSHELRTPVTSIKGFTETLLEGAYKDEAITYEFLTIIQKESTRMENLVKDLLDLSQIEKQDFTLNLSNVNITELVHTISKMLMPAIEEKNIELSIQAEQDLFIWADEQRLIQIIVNILTNAKNYTPKEGKIFVEIIDNEAKNRVEVKISDTGIGIPEKDLSRIFERFYRADRARSRDSGGTGLGLSIVKHLMQAHHGKVKVTSKIGEGTTFTLIFRKDAGLKNIGEKA